MTAAIGAIAASNPAATGSGASPVALQAQLDRYNTQLGDWVSCPSGKTPQGQKVIQALEQKISELKARIETSANARSPSSSTTPPANANDVIQPNLSPSTAVGTLGTLLYAIA